MRVYTLYSDGTASEVILELRAPDPGGDPVKATVIGAEDAAARASAERAVKAAYSLLTRRGYDPAQLRYSASFNLDPPSRTPASGDSAGLAFLIKFLAAVIEKESGEEHENLVVAATGVISESSADARVGQVGGILERIMAADDALPPGTAIFLPQENLDGLRDSGELATLDSQLKARLKGIASIGEVLAWADSVMPLESHLPTWTRIGYVDPSAAKSTAAPSTTQPARRAVPGGSSVQPSAAALSRSGSPPARGTPLWLKRLILYSSSFCVGPLILVAAFLSHGGAARQTEPGKPGVATPTPPAAHETPSPTRPGGLPAVSTPAVEAARILKGKVRYEMTSGDFRVVDVETDKTSQDLGTICSGGQIAFREIEFSAQTHFYLFSFNSWEPFLSCIFPGFAGVGTDERGNPVQNPLEHGAIYHFPGKDKSQRLGRLERGSEPQIEMVFLITSNASLPKMTEMVSQFDEAMMSKDKERAAQVANQFAKKMLEESPGVRVFQITYRLTPPEESGAPPAP